MAAEILQQISWDESPNTASAEVDYVIVMDSLQPEIITAKLGILPSRAWAKGEMFTSKQKDVKNGRIVDVQIKRMNGLWALNSAKLIQSKRVEEHLICLIDLLEPSRDKIQSLLQDPLTYIRFYLRWVPQYEEGSYEITSKTLERATSLCRIIEFVFATQYVQKFDV